MADSIRSAGTGRARVVLPAAASRWPATRAAAAGVLALALLLAAAGVPSAAAQMMFPHDPNQPDLPLEARERSAVIDSIVSNMTQGYVFPEKGVAVAKALKGRLARHGYDAITGCAALADTLTAQLQAITHDRHLRVVYVHDPLPAEEGPDHGPSDEEVEQQEAAARQRNFGFEKMERLPGNVGYLEVRQFFNASLAGATAAAAMNWLANTDALIIDVRRNGGGDAGTVALVCSYLFPARGRVHLNDFYIPREQQTLQTWTLPYVPGQRYVDRPVYVLTSGRTFSAAEEFAYDLKTQGRATLVGEVTGGGAHPVQPTRLTDHFGLSLPWGRAINPVTKTNWEGTGVAPDVVVPADQALAKAQHLALEALLARNPGPEQKRGLEMALKELDAAAAKAGS